MFSCTENATPRSPFKGGQFVQLQQVFYRVHPIGASVDPGDLSSPY